MSPPTRAAPCETGDTIHLDLMGLDPDPLPPGATGVVTDTYWFAGDDWQVTVKWDPPHERRRLSLVYPEDHFTVLKKAPKESS
jgi:hypothetical protein